MIEKMNISELQECWASEKKVNLGNAASLLLAKYPISTKSTFDVGLLLISVELPSIFEFLCLLSFAVSCCASNLITLITDKAVTHGVFGEATSVFIVTVGRQVVSRHG